MAKKIKAFSKTPTGISGLDEITQGGFPKGRPVLICGSAGCGKTLFAAQFLVKGITDYNEPGVFMSFEETPGDLMQNVGSLGFDLEKLVSEKKLAKVSNDMLNKEFTFKIPTPKEKGKFRLYLAIKTGWLPTTNNGYRYDLYID